MAVPLKFDITSGDKITPREIEYSYKLMWENRSISILAYNLSTILAEKLETIRPKYTSQRLLRCLYFD